VTLPLYEMSSNTMDRLVSFPRHVIRCKNEIKNYLIIMHLVLFFRDTTTSYCDFDTYF
jgi:hypothetical protein